MKDLWVRRYDKIVTQSCAHQLSPIESLISGSISSVFTTVLYQPLELLKTRIQLQASAHALNQSSPYSFKFIGRTTSSARELIHNHSFGYLWRGTAASLLRSVPGVGLYYALLNILQKNLSVQHHKPDNPIQALYFGMIARSMVSFILLPITVVKVRYESGQYKYASLSIALKEAYFRNGWIGVGPTIVRDSLFSGIYYMCYMKLKYFNLQPQQLDYDDKQGNVPKVEKPNSHSLNFRHGVISGLVASVITNPFDVLKTKIQVKVDGHKSMRAIANEILKDKGGPSRFFDGLVPRSLRRTLIAASTWTFYEFLIESFKH